MGGDDWGGEFKTMMGEEDNNNNNGATMHTIAKHNKSHKIKQHIIYLFFCNRTVVAKAKQRHANPWNIDMIFMDVLCCDVGRMDQVDKGA
jgi:hypothetical protein